MPMGAWSRAGARRQMLIVTVCLAMSMGVWAEPAAAAGGQTSPGSTPSAVKATVGREVDTVWTSDVGIPRPNGVAYDPSRRQFLVTGDVQGRTALARLDRRWQQVDSSTLTGVSDVTALAFDASADSLTLFGPGGALRLAAGDLGRAQASPRPVPGLEGLTPDSATIDPQSGSIFTLESSSRRIQVTDIATGADGEPIPLPGGTVGGLVAYNSQTASSTS